MSVCFCTLAIGAPYRRRARLLCADIASVPFVVFTDEPGDFADLPIRAIRHAPTGPMAVDYLQRPELTTRVGNMPELVVDGENGLFFDGSVADLAGKLAALRDEPELASRLAARMLDTISTWDWRVCRRRTTRACSRRCCARSRSACVRPGLHFV